MGISGMLCNSKYYCSDPALRFTFRTIDRNCKYNLINEQSIEHINVIVGKCFMFSCHLLSYVEPHRT